MTNRQHKNISYAERLKIECLYKEKYTVQEIAIHLNRGVRTIYRELKRGYYTALDGHYRYVKLYSADIAQKDVYYANSGKGAPLKIDKDYDLVNYIEHKIINCKYSPGAVLGDIELNKIEFNTKISKTTLYRYIDSGLFLNISNKNLPQGKRKTYQKIKRYNIKKPLVKSITERKADRQDFGHWEVDTVIGKKQGKQNCLLVLTERKTRYELIFKMRDKTVNSTIKTLTRLKRQYKDFKQIFKSFTCDNGAEFQDCKAIEKVIKTDLYYCHPYSSWERGSNENANKLIRRHIPKGQSINQYTNKDIKYIENWINNYPRAIHNNQSAHTLFMQEVEKNKL